MEGICTTQSVNIGGLTVIPNPVLSGVCTVQPAVAGVLSAPYTDFAIISRFISSVWSDTMTLWDDAIQQWNTASAMVQTVYPMNGNYIAMLQANNPAVIILPVHYTAQPAFNPATQEVVRTDWIITDVDVQPVWTVKALTGDKMTLNTTDLSQYIANWLTLTVGDKDTVLYRLTEITVLLLSKYIVH
jgi:hypothetical protein